MAIMNCWASTVDMIDDLRGVFEQYTVWEPKASFPLQWEVVFSQIFPEQRQLLIQRPKHDTDLGMVIRVSPIGCSLRLKNNNSLITVIIVRDKSWACLVLTGINYHGNLN